MAYEVRQPLGQDDEEKKASEFSTQAPSYGSASPPAAGGSAPAPAQAAPAAPGSSLTGTTGASQGNIPGDKFVNFDRIVGANADVAKRNAAELANHYSQPADKAAADLASRQHAFTQGVNSGSGWSSFYTMPTGQISAAGVPGTNDPGLMDFDRHAVETASGMPSQWHQVNENPTAALGAAAGGASLLTTPGKALSMDAARTRAGATYTGPNSLADAPDWAKFSGDAAAAAEQASGLASAGGLSAAIASQEGGAVGTGANRLESALLGGAGGQQFRDMAQKYGSLGQIIDSAQSKSEQQAAGAKKAVTDQATYWGGKVKERETKTAEQADWLKTQRENLNTHMTGAPDKGVALQNAIQSQYGDQYFFMPPAQQKQVLEGLVRQIYGADADRILKTSTRVGAMAMAGPGGRGVSGSGSNSYGNADQLVHGDEGPLGQFRG